MLPYMDTYIKKNRQQFQRVCYLLLFCQDQIKYNQLNGFPEEVELELLSLGHKTFG